MKHEQVVVDYMTMFKTSLVYLALVAAGYILIRLLQTIFLLPKHLERNQKRLEELAMKYNIDLKEIENELELDEQKRKNDEIVAPEITEAVKEPKKDK